ncbi:MAG: glutathione binding-like protein, partial [Acetobacteraceae bacterium]|nr:glutathione binding-like protein [Acetobacteraceae bacterium]
ENIAILDWIAHQDTALRPSGPMGHTHLLEALAFISTELHKSFKPFFSGAGAEDKAKAGELIGKRMGYLAGTMQGDYLFGSEVSVADCYLFVMLLWAKKFDLEPPAPLAAFRDRMMKLPAVEKAMEHEGIA